MSETRETLSKDFLPAPGSPPVDWIVAEGLTDYAFALQRMEDWAAAIAEGREPEKVWLVEHPPLYTAGTSARPQDLLTHRLPVFSAGRGGQYTYHGPGQRVAYVLLDLSRRRRDVRAFVGALEAWLIAALALFNVKGETREDRVGVWTPRPDKPAGLNGEPAEDKIAAIGVRLRRWVSFHGVSLNVEPDLRHFAGIVPCGIGERHLGVTSLVDLGLPVTMMEADVALHQAFGPIFGATRIASAFS
ncbi:lipoyl(octanoyl) transferase [Rhodoblastus acidophilus]|uniref:lipoyl(octanoyl) transferase LipB n=1 Tax=Rhodoblastus acidophilus TaxID=1074 RepID=UPI002225195A|nr:lipoyl(octanoyl) transferase LipB [Rhodoblastus acidophilus]MCW2317443.1 lipoyl(octanoyl) transferase [Rhodoblastus acidophilus]